jgi:hypothetical protein
MTRFFFLSLNSIIIQHDVDNRRRLSEIKNELQGLMRQKVKRNVFEIMFLFFMEIVFRKNMMKKN